MPHDVHTGIVEQPQEVEDLQRNKNYAISADYDVELKADSDDDWWRQNKTSGVQTHFADSVQNALHNSTNSLSFNYFAQMRFQLNISQGSTITAATLTFYETEDLSSSYHSIIRRIDETNVGSLEDDTSKPIPANDTTAEYDGWNGVQNEWSDAVDVQGLIQEQVNLGGWQSEYYIGFQFWWDSSWSSGVYWIEDFQNATSDNHPYLNITYSIDAPENTETPTCTNLDDGDNMYLTGKEYQITVNTTDSDGFDAIDYVELAIWTNDRGTEVWRVRFDEDTATFTEQYDPNNMITLNTTSSTNSSSGNNVNATFYVALHSNHTVTANVDARQYVLDNETNSDTDWYEVDWDIVESETEYNVELASDNDDDWWRWQSGSGWDGHFKTSTTLRLSNTSTVVYTGHMRFRLGVPKNATILTATLTFYETVDMSASYTTLVKRINETNVGPLEFDTAKPVPSNTSYAVHEWDGVDNEWSDPIDISTLVQEQVDLPYWLEWNHIGFEIGFNDTWGSGIYDIEDYQNGTSSFNPYLNITYSGGDAESAYGQNWLTGWDYRQQHNISQTDGTGADYTVPIYVWNGNGGSWEQHGYTEGYAQDDFDDIRWTWYNGSTELEYQLNRTWDTQTTDYISNNSEDFASYDANYPCSYYYDGCTYMSRVGVGHDPFVTYYNHSSGTWAGWYRVGDNERLYVDDDAHGSPVLFVDDEGYIHVFWGAHASNQYLQHSRSTNPNNITSWLLLDEIYWSGTGSSYPHINYDRTNDILHMHMRTSTTGTQRFIEYRNSTDSGVTWSDSWYIADFSTSVPYILGASAMDSTNTTLSIGFRRYNFSNGENENIYYLLANFSESIVYNASGSSLGTTVTDEELPDILVRETGYAETYAVSVHVDENDDPYLMWAVDKNGGSGSVIMFTYWNGTGWNPIDNVTDCWVAAAGHDFIVYDSTNITAFLSESTGSDKNMTKFTWDGNTWTRDSVIREGGTRYLCFSVVPINHHDEIQVVFTEYIPNDQAIKMYAWGTEGFVQWSWPKHALFYVKVPTDLTNLDASIYFYYGNATASTTSNASMVISSGNDPIQGEWLEPAFQQQGNSPENTETPTCTNLDDSTYIYSQYKDYIITANVSDVDGFLNLDYVEITLYDNARGTSYWTLRFDEDTATFTEESDTNNIVTLNTSACTNVSSGNTLNVTFYLTLHWNHSDLLDTDVRQYVVDVDTYSDTDWYEVDWDIESDVTTTFTLSDGSGTTDRGNINGIDTITASGTVTYQGSSLYPPSDTADVWINCTDVAGQPWSATTLSSGAWSVTVDSDDVVGLDTYWAYVVEEGDGMTGTHVNATSATDTYIADQIIVQGWHTDDDPDLRIDVGSSLNVTVWLQYVYDSTNVTDGTVLINTQTATYVGAGNWSYVWTETSVGQYFVNDVQCSGNTHGITAEDQNGFSVVCIWDRLIIDVQADNENVGNGEQVNFTLTVTYEYDSAACTTYTIQIARNGTNWYVFTYGNRSLFNDTNSDAVYLYNATTSGANVTESAHGLTIFTTNTETVTWSSEAPVNNETPSGSNFDDTDNLYAWYREYIILTNHSDDGGFGDIHIVQFSLWDDTRTTEYFRLQFNEDTATFTKVYEDVANMITLNITSCSNSSSGIYLNITWHIWVHWNFTPLAGDSDSRLYVNDTVGTSDIDWYETDWDPITTCSVSTSYLDDGIGTVDRGTYGLNDSIWANGTLSYLTGVGGGDNYPPANRIDLWINGSACAYSPWAVTSYDDSTGAFSALVDSGDSPKISPNYDLYQVTAVEEGGAFDSDNFVVGGTDDYKPDIINVYVFNQADGRIDINTAADMEIELRYHYDTTYVTSGSFSCNGTAMSYNGVSLRWDLLPTKSTVQGINYSSVIGADANIGVNIVNMSGYYRFQIWDRLVIDIEADDNSPYNDQEVSFTLTVTYEYDSAACTTYTIQIDRNATHWYVFTYSNRSLFDDTNSDVLYLYNASSTGAGVWDSTYGLSAFITNLESVIWSGTGFPDWHVLPDVRIWFYIPFSEWHINGLFVLLGLIMIPASSMYLVRGGRKELSTDKLFYTLLIFFIGWALLIGGIMP